MRLKQNACRTIALNMTFVPICSDVGLPGVPVYPPAVLETRKKLELLHGHVVLGRATRGYFPVRLAASDGKTREYLGRIYLSGMFVESRLLRMSTAGRVAAMPRPMQDAFYGLVSSYGNVHLRSGGNGCVRVIKYNSEKNAPVHMGIIYPDGKFVAKLKPSKKRPLNEQIADLTDAARGTFNSLMRAYGRLELYVQPNGNASVYKYSNRGRDKVRICTIHPDGSYKSKRSISTSEIVGALTDAAKTSFEILNAIYGQVGVRRRDGKIYLRKRNLDTGKPETLGILHDDGTFTTSPIFNPNKPYLDTLLLHALRSKVDISSFSHDLQSKAPVDLSPLLRDPSVRLKIRKAL